MCEEYLLERSFVVAAYLDQTYPVEVFVVEVGIWRNNHSGWRGKGVLDGALELGLLTRFLVSGLLGHHHNHPGHARDFPLNLY